ncbi:hypothetical protein [Pseudomonas sp.]|uniref:hypothetical protein n=1 Tax=Pseudomonas sp. TaxID=306 RepID=UPI003F35BA4B
MPNYVHAFPDSLNVEQMRDYFEWHVQNGRSNYRVEFREHYPALPPDGDTHDDRERLVFLKAVY